MYKLSTLSADMLFAHWVRQVTILVDRGHQRSDDDTPGGTRWIAIQRFVNALAEETLFLSKMKIATQQHAHTRLDHRDEVYLYFQNPLFLGSPPSFLHGLWLVQRCEGYRLDYDSVRFLVRHHLRDQLPGGSQQGHHTLGLCMVL
jgi:hypothetical protein